MFNRGNHGKRQLKESRFCHAKIWGILSILSWLLKKRKRKKKKKTADMREALKT